jgi:hypothetical protein
VASDDVQDSLDPGALEMVRQSAGWLSQAEDAFAVALRANLAALIPDARVDLWPFCQRMVHAVLWAALTGDPPAAVAGSLRWVGATNYWEGFGEAQYVNVAHALVQAVHELSGPGWSTSMGSAWISYFLWLRPHLLAGARDAAAQQAAQQAAQRAAEDAAREAAWQAAQQEAQLAAQQRRPADVNVESVASLLDQEDEEDRDVGLGQIMVEMTRTRRDRHPHWPG